MTDRELLEKLFNLLVRRNFVAGDEASIRDMVKRYQQPPLTLYHRVAMQLTTAEYKELGDLLEDIVEHFNPSELVEPVEGESVEPV